MNSSFFIGFGHRARSGKDTAAATIIKSHDEMYIKRYGFGDELKREVTQAALSAGGMKNLFGTWEFYRADGAFVELPQWVLDGYEENPDMSDPFCPLGKQRTLLQWWGTEFRRSVDDQYWLKKLLSNVSKDKPEVALITDVRFPNELQFVKDLKGETVRVDRPTLAKLSNASHPSEQALANVPDEEWSRVIANDGTIEEFQKKVLDTFDTFMEFRQ